MNSRLDSLKDDELLRLISQKSQPALEALYKRYYAVLCQFSTQILQQPELAQEAVSDVFLRIWYNSGNLQIKSSVQAYLYKAVRNQSFNYLRKPNLETEDLQMVDRGKNHSPLSADGFLLHEEFRQEIDRLMDQLPKRRRLIFHMHRFQGMKYREIAEALSISERTVQNHMVEAIKQLAGEYNKIRAISTFCLFLLL